MKTKPPQKRAMFDDKMHSKPLDDKTNCTRRSEKTNTVSSSNKILFLGCLIYFTYSLSIAVDSQFLSLFYKSKGFDGATLGFLYSLTPLTTFLTVPIWGVLTREVFDEGFHKGNRKNHPHKISRDRPFQFLFVTIVTSTLSQISLAFLDQPIYMMFAIVIAGMFQSPTKPMLDGIVMDYMDDHNDFGKIRFFSILGSGFGTNLGGRLLTVVQKSITEDQKSTSGDSLMIANNHDGIIVTANSGDYLSQLVSGFNLLFLARLVLTIPTMLCVRQLQIAATMKMENGKNSVSDRALKGTKTSIDRRTFGNEKENSTMVSMARDVTTYCFGDRNHFLFFLCIYIAGASGGVSDTFSYPRYQEAACSTIHMGHSRLLSSCAGAIMFWYSGRVTRRLGIHNVLVLSLICAGFRFSLLRRMSHPYYVYIVDLIRSITYGVFWSSSTIYASQIGPPGLRGTVLLLLNGIYNGIGRSTGAVMGGKFQAIFGTNNLFLCCSRVNYVLALVMGVLYRTKVRQSKKSNISKD